MAPAGVSYCQSFSQTSSIQKALYVVDLSPDHDFYENYTRQLRTLLDLVDAGSVERRLIRQELRQAVDRGLITHQQFRAA